MMRIGGDRLLTIADVVEKTGFCRTVASALMDETGKAIVLHRPSTSWKVTCCRT